MLIIDMKMPKNCGECRFCDGASDKYVCIAKCCKGLSTRSMNVTRPDWCPIKGELVRCGECKMGIEENDEKYCGGEFHKLDWFCADGVRKDEPHEVKAIYFRDGTMIHGENRRADDEH